MRFATFAMPDGQRSIEMRQTGRSRSDFEIAISSERSVLVGRTEPSGRQPGEGDYVSFWILGPEADTKHEYDKVFGGLDAKERLFGVIMHGLDMEPELPVELLNLDGVSVIRIDLEKHLPGHVVYVPERYIP